MATTSVLNIPESDVTLAWRSPYVSEALNRKAQSQGRGVIRGFRPTVGVGARELRFLVGAEGDSVVNGGGLGASFDHLLTYRAKTDIAITLPNDAGALYFIYFVAGYSSGATTTPRLIAYTEADFTAGVPQADGGVLLCAATVPAGATPCVARDIHFSGSAGGRLFLREIHHGNKETASLSAEMSRTTDTLEMFSFGVMHETLGSSCLVVEDGTAETGKGFLRCIWGAGEGSSSSYASVYFSPVFVESLSPMPSKIRLMVRYRTSVSFAVTPHGSHVETCFGLKGVCKEGETIGIGYAGASMSGLVEEMQSGDRAERIEFTTADATTSWRWKAMEFDLSREHTTGGQIESITPRLFWGAGWGVGSELDIDRVVVATDLPEVARSANEPKVSKGSDFSTGSHFGERKGDSSLFSMENYIFLDGSGGTAGSDGDLHIKIGQSNSDWRTSPFARGPGGGDMAITFSGTGRPLTDNRVYFENATLTSDSGSDFSWHGTGEFIGGLTVDDLTVSGSVIDGGNQGATLTSTGAAGTKIIALGAGNDVYVGSGGTASVIATGIATLKSTDSSVYVEGQYNAYLKATGAASVTVSTDVLIEGQDVWVTASGTDGDVILTATDDITLTATDDIRIASDAISMGAGLSVESVTTGELKLTADREIRLQVKGGAGDDIDLETEGDVELHCNSVRAYCASGSGASGGFYVYGTSTFAITGGLASTGVNWSNVMEGPGGYLLTAASRAVLKKDIGDIPLGLQAVLSLHPVQYRTRNVDESEDFIGGFIAEEVAAVSPLFVILGEDWEYEAGTEKLVDGKKVLKSDEQVPADVDQRALLSAAVKAIQELSAKVDAMQVEIDTLKGV